MKKTFNLTAPNKKPANQADSVKHEIKKYLARERRKTLPESTDFWDFDCRFGDTEQAAKEIHLDDIGKCIFNSICCTFFL